MAEHLTFAQAEEYRKRLGLPDDTPIYPGLSAGTIQIPVSNADGTAVADDTIIYAPNNKVITIKKNVISMTVSDFENNVSFIKTLGSDKKYKFGVPIGHDIVKYNHDPLSSLGKVERALGVPLREVDDRAGKKRIAIDAELTAAEAQIIENRIDELIKDTGKSYFLFGGASQSAWLNGKAMVSLDYTLDSGRLNKFWKDVPEQYLTDDLRSSLQESIFRSKNSANNPDTNQIAGFAENIASDIKAVNGKYVVVLPNEDLAKDLGNTLRRMAGKDIFRFGADNSDYFPGTTYAENLISTHGNEVRIDPILASGKTGRSFWSNPVWWQYNNILESKLDNSELDGFRARLFQQHKEAADKILENSGTRIDAALKNAQDSAKKAEEIANIMADKEAAKTAKKAADDAKKAAETAKENLKKIKLTDGLSKDGKEENDRLIAQAQELVTTVTAAQKKAEDNLETIKGIAKEAKVPIDDIIKTTPAAAKEKPTTVAGQKTEKGSSEKSPTTTSGSGTPINADDTPAAPSGGDAAPAGGGPDSGPNQNQAANGFTQNAFTMLGAGLPLLMMLMGFMDPIMGIIALIAGLVIGGTMDAQNGGFLGSLFSGQQPAPPVTLKSLDKDGSNTLSINELKALSDDGNLDATELAKLGAEGQTLVDNIAQLVKEEDRARVFTRDNNQNLNINMVELGTLLAPNTQIQIPDPAAGRGQ